MYILAIPKRMVVVRMVAVMRPMRTVRAMAARVYRRPLLLLLRNRYRRGTAEVWARGLRERGAAVRWRAVGEHHHRGVVGGGRRGAYGVLRWVLVLGRGGVGGLLPG